MNRMIARLRAHGIVTASHMIGIGIMLLVLGLANTRPSPWLSAVVAAAGLFLPSVFISLRFGIKTLWLGIPLQGWMMRIRANWPRT